jgi:hypothetical protein
MIAQTGTEFFRHVPILNEIIVPLSFKESYMQLFHCRRINLSEMCGCWAKSGTGAAKAALVPVFCATIFGLILQAFQ